MAFHTRRSIVQLALMTTAVIPVLSQTPTANKPSFEVVSVKRNTSGNGPGSLNTPGGRLIATNVTLRPILKLAYRPADGQLLDDQIIGAPSWVDSDKFDIEAKSAGDARPTPRTQLQPLVQALLEDRFQLKVHREVRDLPVYSLVVAKAQPKIKLSEDQTSPPPVPVPSSGPIPRGGYISSVRQSGVVITGVAITISTLASLLEARVDRHIVDKTDLKGLFDFKLEFSRELTAPSLSTDAAIPNNAPAAEDPTNPTLFTAIQEQLGLKLEAAKAPVEVIVIESVRKPTEN
jgi:uncharacterized protein (TIGR03435 family)